MSTVISIGLALLVWGITMRRNGGFIPAMLGITFVIVGTYESL